MQEPHRRRGRSHEELVDAFRLYIHQRVQQLGGAFLPAEIVRAWLTLHDLPRKNGAEGFYLQLQLAWDALAYDFYKPGSLNEYMAGETLCHQHQYAGVKAIKFSDPLQVQLIDALTEAVGIFHQRGSAEITIPEKLRQYEKWASSKEYRERLAKC